MESKSLSMTPLRIGTIVLTLVTAFVHLYLSVSSNPFDPIFFLNFLGYIGLLLAYNLRLPIFERFHAWLRWAYMAFALVTIIAYFVVNGFTNYMGFGLPTKAVEVVLIVLLWFDKE